MTRFVVDLGDIPLSKEDIAAINSSIQKAALSHLAQKPPAMPLAFRFPKEWLGLILRKDFQVLNQDIKRIDDAMGRL